MCEQEDSNGGILSDEEEWFIDGKRVAIVGSRYFNHYIVDGKSHYDLSPIFEFVGSLPYNCVIISGGARGPDTAAKQAAKLYGFQYKEWPAEWSKFGKQAGYLRNNQIVNDCDIVIAFWDGISRGTKHTIDIARERGKRIVIIAPTKSRIPG